MFLLLDNKLLIIQMKSSIICIFESVLDRLAINRVEILPMGRDRGTRTLLHRIFLKKEVSEIDVPS